MRVALAAGLAGLLLLLAPGGAVAQADVVWLCKPGVTPNPCSAPADTTVRSFGGAERVEREAQPAEADLPVDCFYVYPTVSNQPTPAATKERDPELASIAKFQAARFGTRCRLFAPVYRQATLASIGAGGASPAVRATAYADVREAWRAYRAENPDRGVVLLAHSQGTRMLSQLLKEEIDPDPAARRRLVSALLIGGNAVAADFPRVPLCRSTGQAGCVVAFSTFAEDPPANARFGRPVAGREVACTDPVPLAGFDGPLRLLVPTEPFAPGPIAAGIVITGGGPPPTAPTTYVVPPDRYRGGCRTINGAHVLRYDPEPGSRRPGFFPDPTWGTHLIDVNLALEPLLEIVRRQTATYLRPPELRLTRRCVGRGRLRVALIGDTAAVRDVSFKVDRRLARRDTAAPFTTTLTRRQVARRGTLRAVAYVTDEPRPRVLTRNLPSCGIRR